MSSHRIEIIKELRALEQFCTFKAVRTGEESERFLKDYLADIQEFPFEAIQKACQKWRTSGQTKFPAPGQLIPLIREAMPVEKGAPVKFWTQANPDEYRGMSVREKLRELSILAHEARGRAGPMFKNTSQGPRMSGVHLQAHELPAQHRIHTADAERYEAEIARLRQILRTPYQQAAE